MGDLASPVRVASPTEAALDLAGALVCIIEATHQPRDPHLPQRQ
jgi:hypothetical protein